MKKFCFAAICVTALILIVACGNSYIYESAEIESETKSVYEYYELDEATAYKIASIAEIPAHYDPPQITGQFATYGTNWRQIVAPIFRDATPFARDASFGRSASYVRLDEEYERWSGICDLGNFLLADTLILNCISHVAERFPIQSRPSPICDNDFSLRIIRETAENGYLEGVEDIETGRVIITPIYEQVRLLCEYLIAVMPEGELLYHDRLGEYLSGKWGIVDVHGQEIAPAVYDGVFSFSPGIAAVAVGEPTFAISRAEPFVAQWGLMNRYGEIILPIEYASIDFWGKGGRSEVARVNKGGHWDWAIGMQEGAYFDIIGGYWGFLRPDGTWAVPPEIPFDWVGHPCADGLVLTEHNRLMGVIRVDLNPVPPYGTNWVRVTAPSPRTISGNHESPHSLTRVRSEERNPSRFGVVDNYGNEILPKEHGFLHIYNEVILARSAEYLFVFNHQGEEILSARAPEDIFFLRDLRGDFSAIGFVCADGTAGLFDFTTGETLIPTGIFDDIHMYAFGMAVVSVGEREERRMGLVEVATGYEIVQPTATNVRILTQNAFAVTHGGELTWNDYFRELDVFGGSTNIVNRNGAEIASEFSAAQAFAPDGDLIIVGNRDGQGIINSAGEIILPLEFSTIFPISRRHEEQPFAVINNGGWWGLPIAELGHNLGTIIGGYWGFADANGNIIVPPELPFMWVGAPSAEGYVQFEHNGLLGYIRVEISPCDIVEYGENFRN